MKLTVLIILSSLLLMCNTVSEKEPYGPIITNSTSYVSELTAEQEAAFEALNTLQTNTDT